MTRYHVQISNQSKKSMADLIQKHKIQILNHRVNHTQDSGYLIDAIAVIDEIQLLKENGYSLQTLKNMNEGDNTRQKEIRDDNCLLSCCMLSTGNSSFNCNDF